jgi:putative endonuclease
MYTVYVLYSEKYDKIYIGYSSDIDNRILSHNSISSNGWTKNFRPWKLIYSEEINDKSSALKREKELKTARGRKYIWKEILKKPER